MKKALLFCLAVVFKISLFAQDLPPIQTDRPDQTEAATITPVGYIQLESGLNYEQNDASTKTIVYPTLLAKYGVNERFEWRLIFNYNSVETGGVKTAGVLPLTAGFKVALWEQHGIIPKASFIGHMTAPFIASKGFRNKYYSTDFRFTLSNQVTDNLSIGYNLGAGWDGLSGEPEFIYTVAAGYSFSEKWGAYIEAYGFAPQNRISDHRADGGFIFIPHPNFQIDLSGGLGISKNSNDYYYVSLGLSYRFKCKK